MSRVAGSALSSAAELEPVVAGHRTSRTIDVGRLAADERQRGGGRLGLVELDVDGLERRPQESSQEPGSSSTSRMRM